MLNLTILEFFIVSGGVWGIFFSFVLLANSKKKYFKQNIFLSLYITAFSVVILKGWYGGSAYYLQNPKLLFLPLYFTFGIGPLFYIYVSYMLRNDFKVKVKHLVHFLPVLVQFSYNFILFLKPLEKRILFFENIYIPKHLPYEEIAGIISIFFYYFFSYKLYRKYNKSIYNNYTDVKTKTFKWIKYNIIAVIHIFFFWITLSIIDFYLYDYDAGYDFYYLLYLFIVLHIFWLMFRGFFNPSKIQAGFVYSSSKPYSLPQDEIKTYIEKLLNVMEQEHLFLNPKLSLKELADTIDIKPKYLSQIINKNLNKNFYDFVNKYRIEKAKEELIADSNKNITISAISCKCGFNSKSTFNDIFKKYMKCTPSEYIKKTVKIKE